LDQTTSKAVGEGKDGTVIANDPDLRIALAKLDGFVQPQGRQVRRPWEAPFDIVVHGRMFPLVEAHV
jgi:hypothetical protein